jgi:hypothetical protein
MPQQTKNAPVRPSELLAAAAALAAGTQAYGEVIIFINPEPGEPGHFNWSLDNGENWLDVTQPSTHQGGLEVPTGVAQLLGSLGFGSWNFTVGGAAVAAAYVNYMGYGEPTASLLTGSAIDGQLDWVTVSTHAAVSQVPGYPPYWSSDFSEGVESYMGVRFSDVDGYHYGWIGVMRVDLDLDAFAWGYETEPGVPIVAGIPAPGTLAALAFGAAVTRRGRKRNDN